MHLAKYAPFGEETERDNVKCSGVRIQPTVYNNIIYKYTLYCEILNRLNKNEIKFPWGKKKRRGMGVCLCVSVSVLFVLYADDDFSIRFLKWI